MSNRRWWPVDKLQLSGTTLRSCIVLDALVHVIKVGR